MTNKFNSFFLFVMLITAFAVNSAQNKVNIDPERYAALRDSLSSARAGLVKLKAAESARIDSLKKYSSDLDEKIKMAYQDLYIHRYGKVNGMHVYNRHIWKGMTESMMRDSWGKPDKIEKNVEKWGTFTQWYYGDVTYFFKNGILTDWEEKK